MVWRRHQSPTNDIARLLLDALFTFRLPVDGRAGSDIELAGIDGHRRPSRGHNCFAQDGSRGRSRLMV